LQRRGLHLAGEVAGRSSNEKSVRHRRGQSGLRHRPGDNALNEVDVFFVMDKGQEKEDLVRLRKEICERYIQNVHVTYTESSDLTK
jgi:hypothetical protein